MTHPETNEYTYHTAVVRWAEGAVTTNEAGVGSVVAYYQAHLPAIIALMKSGLEDFFGPLTADQTESNLGTATIDLGRCTVTYVEQTLGHMRGASRGTNRLQVNTWMIPEVCLPAGASSSGARTEP